MIGCSLFCFFFHLIFLLVCSKKITSSQTLHTSTGSLAYHFSLIFRLTRFSLIFCGTCRTQLQMISQVILTTSKDSPQFSLGQLLESWCSMKEIGPSKTSLISLRRTGIKLANKNLQKKKSQLKNKSQLKMNFEKNISI